MQTANIYACACTLPDCLLNGCVRNRQAAAPPRGCICPPTSENTCKRWDCGRRNPGAATFASAGGYEPKANEPKETNHD
jgi:hypothetical protein